MYQIIIKQGIKRTISIIMMLYCINSMAITNHSTTDILAHPPVTGDCASCHPDKKTAPSK